MSVKTDKTQKNKKNILMLVRACVVAAFALILAVAAALAWFNQASPNTGFLQVQVFDPNLMATVSLAQMDGLTEQEKRQGYLSPTDIMAHSYVNITKNFTEANLVPGLGDYYRITVVLPKPGRVIMSAELIGVKWNVPEEHQADLSSNIWIRSFLGDGSENPSYLIFVWDHELSDYKNNVSFVQTKTIGTQNAPSVTNLYYNFYLDREFNVSVHSGRLFTVDHVRITLR